MNINKNELYLCSYLKLKFSYNGCSKSKRFHLNVLILRGLYEEKNSISWVNLSLKCVFCKVGSATILIITYTEALQKTNNIHFILEGPCRIKSSIYRVFTLVCFLYRCFFVHLYIRFVIFNKYLKVFL